MHSTTLAPTQFCRVQHASTEITDAGIPSFEVVRDITLTIRGLKRDINRMEPAVERETSTKERLEKQLKDQRKEKDRDDIYPPDRRLPLTETRETEMPIIEIIRNVALAVLGTFFLTQDDLPIVDRHVLPTIDYVPDTMV